MHGGGGGPHGGASALPYPRNATEEVSVMFLRAPQEGGHLRALLASRKSNGSVAPFLKHYSHSLHARSRTSAIADMVELQTGERGIEQLLLSETLPPDTASFATCVLPADEAHPEGGVHILIMQTAPFKHRRAGGYLPLTGTTFKAHQERMAADAARGKFLVDEDWSAVSGLHSIRVDSLLAIAKDLYATAPHQTPKGSISVDSEQGRVTLYPLFAAALSHKCVQVALQAALDAAHAAHPQAPLAASNPFEELSEIVSVPSHCSPGKHFRLYVTGIEGAHNLQALKDRGVTTIVNCCAADITPQVRLIDPLEAGEKRIRTGEILVNMMYAQPHGGPQAACCAQNHSAGKTFQWYRNAGVLPDLAQPSHWAPFRHAGISYATVFAQENSSSCQDISVGWPAAFALLRDCWRSGESAVIHCKAGLNRSVTTAAVFLMLHRLSADWDSAIALIRQKRKVVAQGNYNAGGAPLPAPHPVWWHDFGSKFYAENKDKPVSCRPPPPYAPTGTTFLTICPPPSPENTLPIFSQLYSKSTLAAL